MCIYTWGASGWVQRGADIDGEKAGDESGSSVSLSADGQTMAIGAKGNDRAGSMAGHVHMYTWGASSWVQRGAGIDGEARYNQAGHSVSLSTDIQTVAISTKGPAPATCTSTPGAPPAGCSVQPGADIDGEAAGDNSGNSVSLSADGQAVAIGAPSNDAAGSMAGHVRIYTWGASSWVQRGAGIDGEAAVDLSGASVSLSADGQTVAIGAWANDEAGNNAGRVLIYTWGASSWVQAGADIDGEAAGNLSGYSVSLSANGQAVAIGAYPKRRSRARRRPRARLQLFYSKTRGLNRMNEVPGPRLKNAPWHTTQVHLASHTPMYCPHSVPTKTIAKCICVT